MLTKYVKFKSGKQSELIKLGIKILGSERALAYFLKTSKISVYRYKFEQVNLPEIFLDKLVVKYPKFRKFLRYIELRLPNNWGKIKGGLNCVIKKEKMGTLDKEIVKLKMLSSERMKQWHAYMKKNEPRKYHTWQYKRFKKVGRGYNLKLGNGIMVRNKLEQTIGNFLLENNFKFEYEPYFKFTHRACFPDFVVGKIIIEVSAWMHPEKTKLERLNDKFRSYLDNGFCAALFVPPHLRKFYKEIRGPVISNLPDLKNFLIASVAQTRLKRGATGRACDC